MPVPGAPASARRSVRLPPRLRRFLRNRLGLVGLAITVGMVLTAAFAPLLAPFDPMRNYPGLELALPGEMFTLGADELGRDLLSRIIYGTRLSLLVGVVAVAIGVLVGGTIGMLAGFFSGTWVETVVMRLTETLLAFPAIILGLAIATVLGPGIMNAALAVGIINIPTFARLARASVLAERSKDYVEAAHSIGSGEGRVLFRHVLPNILSPLVVQMVNASAYAILLEASLSFLGLGAQPPAPSWGTMLKDARQFLRQAPWYGLFPGMALSLMLLGLNFLADAVRDALDPRIRR